MDIVISKDQPVYHFSGPFENSTDGSKADFNTNFEISVDNQFLRVKFVCEDNPFTGDNSMFNHNDPLYNQEVFEVFLAAGEKDSKKYWEVEINPNNAVWIGEIANPDLGDSQQTITRQLMPEEAGIEFGVEKGDNQWSGFLNIPWKLTGHSEDGQYRINFYRIRSRINHSNPDWECDTETCDFVCWKSTLSGKDPAFHRPKRFGNLSII